MKVLEEKHKLATRWFHWVNFPLISLMIVSGMLIYWAYDPYRIGIGSFTLFHFFPTGFTISRASASNSLSGWRFTS